MEPFSAKQQKSVLTVARDVPESAGKPEHKDQNLYCSLQNTKNSEFLMIDIWLASAAAVEICIRTSQEREKPICLW